MMGRSLTECTAPPGGMTLCTGARNPFLEAQTFHACSLAFSQGFRVGAPIERRPERHMAEPLNESTCVPLGRDSARVLASVR